MPPVEQLRFPSPPIKAEGLADLELFLVERDLGVLEIGGDVGAAGFKVLFEGEREEVRLLGLERRNFPQQGLCGLSL